MYNRFAKMRHRYLREHRNGIYTGMFLDGNLEDHLKEIGEAAEKMQTTMIRAMEFYRQHTQNRADKPKEREER